MQPNVGSPVPAVKHERVIDVLIVTALTEEAQVVDATMRHVAELVSGPDIRLKEFDLRLLGDRFARIVCASAHAMGATEMASFLPRILADNKVERAVLVGIAAAVSPGDVKLGDVPFCNQILSYDDIAVTSGALTIRSQGFQVDKVLLAAVGQLQSSPTLYKQWQQECLALVRLVADDVNQLRVQPVGRFPKETKAPNIVVGTGAGGPFLLRDASFRTSLARREQNDLASGSGIRFSAPLHPKLIIAEMESHGFMRAAHDAGVPASVAKGISDAGDAGKEQLEMDSGGFFRLFACANAVLATLMSFKLSRFSAFELESDRNGALTPLQPRTPGRPQVPPRRSHAKDRAQAILEQDTALREYLARFCALPPEHTTAFDVVSALWASADLEKTIGWLRSAKKGSAEHRYRLACLLLPERCVVSIGVGHELAVEFVAANKDLGAVELLAAGGGAVPVWRMAPLGRALEDRQYELEELAKIFIERYVGANDSRRAAFPNEIDLFRNVAKDFADDLELHVESGLDTEGRRRVYISGPPGLLLPDLAQQLERDFGLLVFRTEPNEKLKSPHQRLVSALVALFDEARGGAT